MRQFLFITFMLLASITMKAQQIVFTPQWTPQAQFAGYYVAFDKGFYEEVGVKVEIKHPSTSYSAFNLLWEGSSDIITQQLVQAMIYIDQGMPLVNILQTSQQNGLMLVSRSDSLRTLEDYKGKKVILYFYPKDNTPGCTKQACGFSERYPQIMEQGAIVLGVNKDSVASHKRFEEKYGLAFPLLSDPELEVIQAYDVWQEKKNYGKVSMGVVRTTYLIDEEGVIVKAYDKVKAAEDAAKMIGEV